MKWFAFCLCLTVSMVSYFTDANDVYCWVCHGEHRHCQDRHTCLHSKCFLMETMDEYGNEGCVRGCDYDNHCNALQHQSSVQRLECCDSDYCNRFHHPTNVVYVKGESTQPPTTDTTVVTSPPFYITKGLRCEVCSGALCGVDPAQDSVLTCPDPFPYCMNTVENDDNGNKIVSKRCASKHECQTKWWNESSKRTECLIFDPSELYIKTFSCSYCCETDGCNKEINPNPETRFVGV